MRACLPVVFLFLSAAGGCATPAAAPAPAGTLAQFGESAGGGARFLGSEACRTCHPAAYDLWRATGHARAFTGLAPADRTVASCLRCHVTGYGDPLGYRGDAVEDLTAVGCESCHGPGADHARSAYPAFVPTATGGECPPCEINRICRLCHTPERSKDFDLSHALARISCRDGR